MDRVHGVDSGIGFISIDATRAIIEEMQESIKGAIRREIEANNAWLELDTEVTRLDDILSEISERLEITPTSPEHIAHVHSLLREWREGQANR